MQPRPEPSAKDSTDAQEAPQFKRGAIRDVVVRDLRKFVDERGWLAELFRHDELDAEFYPTMSYVSTTLPGIQRGPHEHVEQADLFCFLGPSNFKMRLWDNRPDSETYRNVMTLFIGEDSARSVLVPRGVVHAYKNIGCVMGVVLNFPNRLYLGEGRREEVDEIRHEDDPDTIFKIDD
ncbi:MAG TPA: dTDP-4-dehydrorhamnose 3,5-epimerase family protein [Pyrinomonadaceae bacterium]|jgi:dTDP-4-dehydrorhamnose 3,5-epimerase|nr:dTDP-4-dehydrorhamnose 3,5-epimerase family protein [Pyrinomonadaceae bacterium]